MKSLWKKIVSLHTHQTKTDPLYLVLTTNDEGVPHLPQIDVPDLLALLEDND
eukprot:SAG11_NODE_32278_length_285_cov_0.349462_1_plen_51_part_10